MKSIKYIIVAGFLALFSCQKEDIKPNRSGNCGMSNFDETNKSALFIQSSSATDEIVKDRISTGSDKDGSTGGSASSDGGVVSTGDLGNADAGGGITDPNNEPDASKRKGKK